MAGETASSQKVVAIIQARMGSRRFPGKVLADLVGRPVLEWVLDAVKRVEGADDIVVATTTNPEDKAIADWCAGNDVNCFRGEPLDVLKRYADCAKEYSATHILRITADCPLLDPGTVSAVLREGLASGADYFGLAGEFPDGFDCEGFTYGALREADMRARDPLQREHVTLFFKSNPQSFKIAPVYLYEGSGDVRLTIDRVEDLQFVSRFLDSLGWVATVPEAPQLVAAYRQLGRDEITNRHITRNEGMFHS
jgi:spore coat polysaccharide biosynthesis protein SpsF (cytidylyltransferase family)